MRISDMLEATSLTQFQFVPIYDPQRLDLADRNLRANITLFKGIQGERGFPGLSAYELYLNQGNTGTLDDFLNSLKGAAGTDGFNGTNGASSYQLWLDAGNVGTLQDFIDSLKGLSAYDIWLLSGNTGSTNDFIKSLQGPIGYSPYDLWKIAGHNGTIDDYFAFITGKSAYQLWLDAGNTGTLNDFLYSLNGANGAQGPQGIPGNQGIQGPPGTPGTRWYNGQGSPTSAIGIPFDYYLNNGNGDLYSRTGTGWNTPITNIRGPQGIQGLQGPPGASGNGSSGTRWYTGYNAPTTLGGIGVTGDYYLNLTNDDVYIKKNDTSWPTTADFNIKGSQGIQGPQGIQGVPGPQGPIGPSGTVGPAGPAGSVLYNGNGVPSNTLGLNNDYYLDNLTGNVYQKVAGTWTGHIVSNIRGPQGPAGPGVAVGGVTSQILVKTGTANYQTGWEYLPGYYFLDTPVPCTFPNTANVWMNADFSMALANVASTIVISGIIVAVGLDTGQGPQYVYGRAGVGQPQFTLLGVGAFSSNDTTFALVTANVPISSDRTCQIYREGNTDSFSLQLIGFITTPVITASATALNFTGGTTTSTGGGRGGGGCVMTSMFLRPDLLADNAMVGDIIYGMDDESYLFEKMPILRISPKEMQPCIMITMASGAQLGFSLSTPLNLENHTSIFAYDLEVGMKLPVRIGEEEAIPFWDPVINIEQLGLQEVALISNQGIFAAGKTPGNYIYTHNILLK